MPPLTGPDVRRPAGHERADTVFKRPEGQPRRRASRCSHALARTAASLDITDLCTFTMRDRQLPVPGRGDLPRFPFALPAQYPPAQHQIPRLNASPAGHEEHPAIERGDEGAACSSRYLARRREYLGSHRTRFLETRPCRRFAPSMIWRKM